MWTHVIAITLKIPLLAIGGSRNSVGWCFSIVSIRSAQLYQKTSLNMNQLSKTIAQHLILPFASKSQSYLWVTDDLHLLSPYSQRAWPRNPGQILKELIKCLSSSLVKSSSDCRAAQINRGIPYQLFYLITE